MVPTMEGEFARKRRMMVGLWDIVVGEGMLSPRGYSPLFAFELASHRLLRYLSPFLHLVAFVANLALLGEGWVYVVTFAVQLALHRRRAARPPLPARPAAHRPLLRDDHRLDRRRPLGPLPPRRRRALGEGARGPADATRPRHPRSPPLALVVLSPFLLVAAIAIKLGSRGPVIYRQRRVGRDGARVRDVKLRTMVAGLRPGRGRHRRHPRRPARHRAPAASCAAPRSTRSPTWSTSCAARWRSSARARPSPPRSTTTRRASTAATRSCPGSPAGPRSRAAPASPGRSGSSSTSGTSTTAPPPSTPASSPRPLWLVVTGQGLAPD